VIRNWLDFGQKLVKKGSINWSDYDKKNIKGCLGVSVYIKGPVIINAEPVGGISTNHGAAKEIQDGRQKYENYRFLSIIFLAVKAVA
jgi:hypothetical protein